MKCNNCLKRFICKYFDESKKEIKDKQKCSNCKEYIQ